MMMKILFLGGTIFLGRWMVEEASRRQHEITLFNRGTHNPELFPEVEKIHGDRDGGLEALEGRKWDAVIDTCGYLPRVVRASAVKLRSQVDNYIFISSISVYADPPYATMDESAPLAQMPDPTVEQITGETYGPLKALCEQAVITVYSSRGLIIRPGLIVGPYDPSDRFTYWPTRVAQGGEIAAPGSPDYPVQFIDVRDLGEWILNLVEKQASGIYHATGPEQPLTMLEFLKTCKKVTSSNVDFTWLDDAFLAEQKVEPFTEMPLWVPGEYTNLHRMNIRPALSTGLRFRPLEATIADTWEWDRQRIQITHRAGLTRLREEQLLRDWKQANRSC
jgi:2'-hydroxyisoflavone reductase